MRNKILMTAIAAFMVSTVGVGGGVAVAQVKPSEFKKDSEKKDPAVADASVAKSEAKSAKKHAHMARKKAHAAQSKAKVAVKKADEAAKAGGAPQ